MRFAENLKHHFFKLKNEFFSELAPHELVSINIMAESTTFVRYNKAQIRQNTQVDQINADLIFQFEGKSLRLSCDLSGDFAADMQRLKYFLVLARNEIKILPADPYLIPIENKLGSLFELLMKEDYIFAEVQKDIADLTKNLDFTGLLSMGSIVRGGFNSKGQEDWFAKDLLVVDYSLFTVNVEGENKAVKSVFTSEAWDAPKFAKNLAASAAQLVPLQRKTKIVHPGSYRCFFAPAAGAEISTLMGWGALSYAAHKQGKCALSKAFEGQKLSPKLHLKENFTLGLTPQFNSLGEMPEREVALIEAGELKSLLISSRTAKEYNVESNFADHGWGAEYPRSLEMGGGSLQSEDILARLGTGLYLSNLHYINWSDIPHARFTGMTRYACFWVENGEIVSPIQDMRFDDTLYRCLGTELEALTESEVDVSTDTYYRRGLGGKKIPGLLVSSFNFTL